MREELESYLLAVVKGDKSGVKAKIVLVVLSLLVYLYRLLYHIRQLLYLLRIFKKKKLSCKVISVGNITTGGTGKTPLVEKLVQGFQKKGKKVVVLSHGYHAQGNKPEVVSDGDKILLDVERAGDELYMMAQHLDGVPIVKGKNRYQAGQLALEEFAPDLIILDDGFQHWPLQRDLDIVVIDALHPFGYNHLLPRGLLREPLSALKRSDIFVITRSQHVSQEKLAEIKRKIMKYNSHAKLFTSEHKPLHLAPLTTGSEKYSCPHELKNKRVMALSGIGNPHSFIRGLKNLKAEVAATINLPDHYHYSNEDMMEIAMKAQMNDSNLIITTDKDAVKFDDTMLSSLNRMKIDLLSLGIELELTDDRELMQEVLRLL